MNMFHDAKSAREKCTAANIRVCFGHKNVLQNTKKCFNATYEFIEFVTASYIVASAMTLMNIQTVRSKPGNLPSKRDGKLLYLSSVAEQVFFSKFCFIIKVILYLFSDILCEDPVCR